MKKTNKKPVVLNIDAEILKKNGSNVTECLMFELQNDCICCTPRDELIQQIEKISNLDTVDVAFVEASVIQKAITAALKSCLDEKAIA